MTDDNIIGIDGRQAAQLRTDQAAVTRSRTRTLRSHRILMDGAICRWTKWKMPRQTLTWVRIHASAAADCAP
jgi:hypothetical protein